MIVMDQLGNKLEEGTEAIFEGKFGPVTIKKITPVMDAGPMNGGILVEGLQLVRFFIPPQAPPVIPVYKVMKPETPKIEAN